MSTGQYCVGNVGKRVYGAQGVNILRAEIRHAHSIIHAYTDLLNIHAVHLRVEQLLLTGLSEKTVAPFHEINNILSS